MCIILSDKLNHRKYISATVYIYIIFIIYVFIFSRLITEGLVVVVEKHLIQHSI